MSAWRRCGVALRHSCLAALLGEFWRRLADGFTGYAPYRSLLAEG